MEEATWEDLKSLALSTSQVNRQRKKVKKPKRNRSKAEDNCSSKVNYNTFSQAANMAKRLNRNHNYKMLTPYRCKVCNRYHLTSVRDSK